MKYKVNYLSVADADVAEIIDYIAIGLGNVTAAASFLDELDRIQGMISDNPFTFRIYERLDSETEEVRVAPIKNYCLFYSINDGAVTVKRVMYKRRNTLNRWGG
jgi:plasmid stabilization system protein ParE